MQRRVMSASSAGVHGAGGSTSDLRRTDLCAPFAAEVFVAEGLCGPQMALARSSRLVGLVALQHVGLQHGVVVRCRRPDAVVGQHMAVVLEVLAELGWASDSNQGFSVASTSSRGSCDGAGRRQCVPAGCRPASPRVTGEAHATSRASMGSSEVVSVSSVPGWLRLRRPAQSSARAW